ncbi:MAG: acyl carrier protein [Synechococcaceae bacterium WB6_1A_059]|nr:acyl carrier protein [Synechococcaceae bacterium WB6_1A_059]
MNEEILNIIINVTKKQFKKYNQPMTADTHIITDLEGDSLDAMEIIMLIEDELNIIIPEEKLEGVRTLGGIANVVSTLVNR